MKRLEELEKTYYDQKARDGYWTSLKMALLPVLLLLTVCLLGYGAYGLLRLFL